LITIWYSFAEPYECGYYFADIDVRLQHQTLILPATAGSRSRCFFEEGVTVHETPFLKDAVNTQALRGADSGKALSTI
jgi:hypothetical protein